MITWLLDVDGVLNIDRSPWHEAPKQKTVYACGASFRMRCCPSLIREIKRLVKQYEIHVVWATSWANHIAQIESAYGFPKWDTMPLGEIHNAFDYKIDVALSYLGNKVIWTDDHAPWMGTLANGAFGESGFLLIAPDERYGLTPEHIEMIENYATEFTRK